MKLPFLAMAIAACCSFPVYSAPFSQTAYPNGPVSAVERYEIAIAPTDYVPYSGVFADRFPGGFRTGLGSGMLFERMLPSGEVILQLITDRGPNADAPESVDGDETRATKLFPSPMFAPRMMRVTVSRGVQAVADHAITFADATGPVSGLPLPASYVGSTGEVALDDRLKPMAVTATNGLDTEGIVADGEGNLWVVDEYGPFIVKFDPHGTMLKKYGPSPATGEASVASGLPSILRWRQANRGFEAIARTPNGKIYAAVQSTLDVDGKTKNSAQFLRVVELDPASGTTRMFAYPHDVADYKKSKDAKLGDMVALNNDEFLLIEQGKGADKKMRNRIYHISLKGASDLSGKEIDGKALEYADAAALGKAGITMISKTLMFDLRDYGWTVEKAEGMALINRNTLAVVSDNDFGLGVEVVGGEDETAPDDYIVTQDGKLQHQGKPTAARIELSPLRGDNASSQLWLIQLRHPL